MQSDRYLGDPTARQKLGDFYGALASSVLVRETASGRTGALRARVTVPSFEGETLVASPPLFVDDPQGRVVLPTPSRMNPGIEIPFRIRDAAFTPDARATLHRGAPQDVWVAFTLDPPTSPTVSTPSASRCAIHGPPRRRTPRSESR